MKKTCLVLATALIISANMSSVIFATTTVLPTMQYEATGQSINPRADVLVYKYRAHNGTMQKRLWNETKGYWVDDEWTTISIH